MHHTRDTSEFITCATLDPGFRRDDDFGVTLGLSRRGDDDARTFSAQR
jgi:hypothetical protein